MPAFEPLVEEAEPEVTVSVRVVDAECELVGGAVTVLLLADVDVLLVLLVLALVVAAVLFALVVADVDPEDDAPSTKVKIGTSVPEN